MTGIERGMVGLKGMTQNENERQPVEAALSSGPPETVALTWGHDEHDALAVRGHRHGYDRLVLACRIEGYSGFATAEPVWVCVVPDRSGKFDKKWVSVDASNRRAQAWTILEGLTRESEETP